MIITQQKSILLLQLQTKKRAGKCIKLSHGVTGCVSGDYMNPFHPDCF